MFSYYFDLLVRAFGAIPASLGGNTLGLIWPLILVTCGELIAGFIHGWKTVISQKLKQFSLIGLASLVVCYALLFGWCALLINYEDHQSLVSTVKSLEKPQPKLTAEIDAEFSGSNRLGFFMAVATLHVMNGIGPERPLSNWQMRLFNGPTEIEAFHFFMPGPIVDLPSKDKKTHITFAEGNYCPELIQSPLPSGTQRSCWMMRYFKIKAKDVEPGKAALVIEFTDVLTGERHRLREPISLGQGLTL